nr:hypothetical protein [Paenibacillus turpanensis]
MTVCDNNDWGIPTGYLGHSAIAVDERQLVEAVMEYPNIQLGLNEKFLRPDRRCAVYRPVHAHWGPAAAGFAYRYYEQSEHYRKHGMIRPPFTISPAVPLHDPWTGVYCSKLVWLSYYYGAGYAIYNDFGLFTPEDVDSSLRMDSNFMAVYRHPDFAFHIDT